MSALAGCPGTSTSVAVLLRRRGRGVASLRGQSREDAGTERGVLADGAVRVAALPHPDARIASTATAAMPRRMSNSLRQQHRPAGQNYGWRARGRSWSSQGVLATPWLPVAGGRSIEEGFDSRLRRPRSVVSHLDTRVRALACVRAEEYRRVVGTKGIPSRCRNQGKGHRVPEAVLARTDRRLSGRTFHRAEKGVARCHA
jgi:hypothetical protein